MQSPLLLITTVYVVCMLCREEGINSELQKDEASQLQYRFMIYQRAKVAWAGAESQSGATSRDCVTDAHSHALLIIMKHALKTVMDFFLSSECVKLDYRQLIKADKLVRAQNVKLWLLASLRRSLYRHISVMYSRILMKFYML